LRLTVSHSPIASEYFALRKVRVKDHITIELVENPDQSITQAIESGLDQHSEAFYESRSATPFAILMKDGDGAIVGGIFAVAFWSGLAIDLFWISEQFRGLGYGSQLLQQAEDEGRRRGADKAFLNTHTFQAPGFYEKHGYELYGELKDFPPGYDRRYYVKALSPLD
jgi:ribosomal protein S18 acetylase RimI-like enzyme